MPRRRLFQFVLRTYIVSTIIISLTAYIPLNMQLLSNEELQRGIKAVDPETFAKMDGHIAVGFNVISMAIKQL